MGSALVRALNSQISKHELILAGRDELDLLNQSEVEQFINQKKPDLKALFQLHGLKWKCCNHDHTDRHSGGYHCPSANNHR